MKDVRLKVWHVLAVILIMFFLFHKGIISVEKGAIADLTKTPEQLGVKVNKRLQLALIDPLVGSVVPGAVIKIYDGKLLMETLTTDSTGMCTTTLPYESGKILNVYIEKGNSKRWVTLKVPFMSEIDARTAEFNFVKLELIRLGNFDIKVIDQFGNVYDGGYGEINFTELGVDTVTLTIQIVNLLDNSGYHESYDPIHQRNWEAVFLLIPASGDLVIRGFDKSYTSYGYRGAIPVYVHKVPADLLIKQKVGTEYVKTGIYTFTITVNKGSLQPGLTETLTLELFLYADSNYLLTNRVHNEESIRVSDMAIHFTR